MSWRTLVPTGIKRQLNKARDRVSIVTESLKDASRHQRFAALNDHVFAGETTSVECQLSKDYHRVEKGLALAQPKRPFGADVARRLELGLAVAEVGGETSSHASSALTALRTWNEHGEHSDLVAPTRRKDDVWGVFEEPAAKAIGRELLTGRQSLRAFADTTIDYALIEDAVSMARFAPSVCNRQATRVHWYDDRLSVERLLELQNGNRGFGHEVPSLAILTTDMTLFTGPGERNQRWIDGGLFSMNFASSLHLLGLATCFLNWSVKNSRSDELRSIAGIREHEDIVTMLAIGYPAEQFRVARSPRRPVSDLLLHHVAIGSIAP